VIVYDASNQQQRGWGWKRHRSSFHAQNRSAFSALFGEPTVSAFGKKPSRTIIYGEQARASNSLEKSTRPDRKPSSNHFFASPSILFRSRNFQGGCVIRSFFASPPVSIIRFGNFPLKCAKCEAEIDPGILWLA